MSRTLLQNDQIANAAQLSSIGAVAMAQNLDIFSAIDKNFDQPLRMYASFPTADAKLNFRANRTKRGDNAGVATPPVDSLVPDVADQWINFQTGAVSGNFDITIPTTTVGQYRRCGFTFIGSTAKIQAVFSLASTTVSGLDNPGGLFVSGGLPLGWIDLEATASTAYKTIGSSTSIIESAVGGTSRINIFGAGGGGGSGGINAYVAKSTTVTSAVSGTFSTGHSGNPVVDLLFWDDSAAKFLVIDPSAASININAAGTSVEYDFQNFTFSANDYIKIIVLYHDLVASLSSEYDSGWVDYSNINNLPSAGWHRVDLPAGFVTHPAGISLLLDSGTEIRPGEIASRVVLSNSGSTYRIAVEVSDLTAGQKFRVVASVAARPSGDLAAAEVFNYSTNQTLGALTAKTTVINVDASGGARTMTLPIVTIGKEIIFVKTDSSANTVTIDGNGSDTINGDLTYVLGLQYEAVKLVGTDTNKWSLV